MVLCISCSSTAAIVPKCTIISLEQVQQGSRRSSNQNIFECVEKVWNADSTTFTAVVYYASDHCL